MPGPNGSAMVADTICIQVQSQQSKPPPARASIPAAKAKQQNGDNPLGHNEQPAPLSSENGEKSDDMAARRNKAFRQRAICMTVIGVVMMAAPLAKSSHRYESPAGSYEHYTDGNIGARADGTGDAHHPLRTKENNGASQQYPVRQHPRQGEHTEQRMSDAKQRQMKDGDDASPLRSFLAGVYGGDPLFQRLRAALYDAHANARRAFEHGAANFAPPLQYNRDIKKTTSAITEV